VRPRVESDRDGRDVIHFAAYEGAHRWSFELRRGPDNLEGTVSDPLAGTARVKLVHAESPERAAVDAAFAGTYAIDGDARRVLFVEGGRLFDTHDGTERRLFLLPGRRALVGSGVGTTYPAAGIARLDGAAPHIEGASRLVAPRLDVNKEEVRFTSSDGITLSGTFISPPGPPR
jgi:hypothetical protein